MGWIGGKFSVVERLQMKSLFQDAFRHLFLFWGEVSWCGLCPRDVTWRVDVCLAMSVTSLAYDCVRSGGEMFGGESGYSLSFSLSFTLQDCDEASFWYSFDRRGRVLWLRGNSGWDGSWRNRSIEVAW
ncbi:hypothetical protein RBSWK_00383 [Rhodopirellula baltica SWK14]|uniref:Uncharacterized protein n=1 Tax=Rhodopirellula baltica SWK14 TaxID=993516 RepID=L7CNX0_RHOBT|nr:hypothetical protein RBSWK_00383 [Rhodopirellula baltica SWK14]